MLAPSPNIAVTHRCHNCRAVCSYDECGGLHDEGAGRGLGRTTVWSSAGPSDAKTCDHRPV